MSDKDTPAQTSAPNTTNPDTSQSKNTSQANTRKPLSQPMAARPENRIPTKAFTPGQAREIMESRAASYKPREESPVLAGGGSKTFTAPTQITELARALKNDLDLIFYHVYNKIDFSLGYGLQKGSLGALRDGTANPWDQAQLLVDLLREAGYTADFVFGTIDLSNQQVSSWLGTDDSDIFNAYGVLDTAAVPVQAVWSGTEWRLEISHVWVKVTIGTDEFHFDPSFKTYLTIAGIDLEDALGYDRTSLLAVAETGATKDVNGEWIENVNTAGIKSELATYATNLVSWIDANNPTATMDDIVGGRKVIEISSPLRQTSLPYEKVGDTPAVWMTIPDVYRVKITISDNARGINFFRYSDELYGKRLTVFFNSSRQPVYRLDGEILATGSALSLGQFFAPRIDFTHPYATTQHNDTQFVGMWAGHPSIANSHLQSFWLIGLSFGHPAKGTLNPHYQRSVARLTAGAPEDDEELVGSQLASVWYTNMAGQAGFDNILGRMTNCRSIVHHAVAVLHRETVSDNFILNFSSPRISVVSLDGITANAIKFSHGSSICAQKQEALCVQQITGKKDAVNSSTVLEAANGNGTRIYRADNNNWNSIKNSLNYPVAVNPDAYIGSFIGSGWVFTIPQAGNNMPGIAGGFEGNHPNGGAAGPIYYGQTALKGCFSSWRYNPDGKNGEGDCGGGGGGRPGGGFPNAGRMPAEGVFAGECGFHYSAPSFTTGSSYPYGLSFEAEYSSCRREVSSPLGLGWSHNWIQNATEKSDPFRGLGSGSPIEAAASLAAFHSYKDLTLDTSLPITNLMTLWTIANWWGDEMTSSIVRIELEDEIREYAKLPDGSYYRKADASTLVKSGDQFILTSPEQIVHTFNSDGNLETIAYPFGVTVSLTYSGGKVTNVDNGIGRSLSLSYSGDHLIAVKDDSVVSPALERKIEFAFSGEQLASIKDPLGESITYQYDLPGRMVKYFLPQNPTSPLVTNSFSADDTLLSQLDANSNQTTFYKTKTRHEFVNALGHSLVYFFDSDERLTKEIDELDFATNYLYDALGRLVEIEYPNGQKTLWTYTSKHKVATVTSKAKPGSGLADIVTSATYDPTFNKIATATDGRGNTASYTYETNGQVATIVSPAVSGGSPTVTITYNDRGQPVTITEPTGIVTKFEYASDTDPQANEVVTKVTLDFGTGRKNLVTEYGYNAWGDIISAKDPRGNVSTATFDYKRRSTQAQSAAPFNFVSKFTFDKNDNLVKTERQTGIPATPWQTSEATHDIDGKLLTTKDSLNIVTTRQYDQLNRLWKFTDGENRTTEQLFDERSQVHTVIEPGNHVVETNTYGPSGELLSVTDEKSFVVQFTVDGFNRRSKVIYPNGTFEQVVSYDANGNALSTLSRAGDATTFTFDALNRPLTKAAAGKPIVSYSYDLAGRIQNVSTPVQGGNPDSGMFQYFYDSAGRGIGEELPDGKTISYDLDQNGNIVRVTYPDSYFVERVFDQLNRLTDIKLNGSTSSAAHFSYNDLSKRTQLSFNNGTLANYEYQANGRLSKIDQQFVGSTVKFDHSYNQAHEAVVSSASSSQFIWTPSLDKTTAYGAVNNLNQYLTVDAQPFSYNSNGCLTSDGVWTFSYDSENQLLSAADGTDVAQFKHDPMNRQTQKDFNSTSKTRFVYSGWQRIADYDGTSGSLQKRYVYGTGLDEPLFEISPAGVITKYFHRDRLGSVVALTDTAGAVTNRYSYSPFGEANDMTGTTFGYTGQRYDSETELWFYKRRYYSAKLGRFLQPDPITSLGNLYAYCSNDPINFADPLGLKQVAGGVTTTDQYFTPLTPKFGTGDPSEYGDAGTFTLPVPDVTFDLAGHQNWLKRERERCKKKKCIEALLAKADAIAAQINPILKGLAAVTLGDDIANSIDQPPDHQRNILFGVEMAMTGGPGKGGGKLPKPNPDFWRAYWKRCQENAAASIERHRKQFPEMEKIGEMVIGSVKRRYDGVWNGILLEIKSGEQLLWTHTWREIIVDSVHARTRELEWHFYKTNGRGPEKALLYLLDAMNIPYFIHTN